MKRMILCSVLFLCVLGLDLSAQQDCTREPIPTDPCAQLPLFQTCLRTFTAQNGNWSTNSGWPAGTSPGQYDRDCVIIPAGVTVVYDVTTPQPKPITQLLINGKLSFNTMGQPTDTYYLRAYLIGVNHQGAMNPGTLEIGNNVTAFGSIADIRLFGLPRVCYQRSNDDYQPCNGGLQVNEGGIWTANGTANIIYQAPLALDAAAGATAITVSGDLTGSWKNNDLLVITSTEYREGQCPICTGDYECPIDQNELVRINGLLVSSGSSTAVPITRVSPPGPGNGLLYAHNPVSIQVPSRVGKVTRNILIQSDPASTENDIALNQLHPSHTVVSPRAENMQLSGVEFYNLAPSDAPQLFSSRVNLYALHVHNTDTTGAVKPRSLTNSSFHNDYFCKTCALNSPKGGFNSQVNLHRVRNATISGNVFYNPLPFSGNSDGAALYANVPNSDEVDNDIFTDNLTITSNLIVTDPSNSCVYGVPCNAQNMCPDSCAGSCKPFVSAFYAKSARHTIDNNFVNGGYYGYYGVINLGVNFCTLINRCVRQSPPTQCDLASFQNNIGAGSLNDNFRYKDLYPLTNDTINNRINVLGNFQSYIGAYGITMDTVRLSYCGTSNVPPRISGLLSRGLGFGASRAGLVLDGTVGLNQIFSKPYQGSAGKSGVVTGGESMSMLTIYNDYNQDQVSAAVNVWNGNYSSCATTVGPVIEKFSNLTFSPETDPAAGNSNRVMTLQCKEDSLPISGKSCIQLCNFSMPASSALFTALKTTLGLSGSQINFIARPQVTNVSCGTTYGLGFNLAPDGFANMGPTSTELPNMCIAPVTPTRDCGMICP